MKFTRNLLAILAFASFTLAFAEDAPKCANHPGGKSAECKEMKDGAGAGEKGCCRDGAKATDKGCSPGEMKAADKACCQAGGKAAKAGAKKTAGKPKAKPAAPAEAKS